MATNDHQWEGLPPGRMGERTLDTDRKNIYSKPSIGSGYPSAGMASKDHLWEGLPPSNVGETQTWVRHKACSRVEPLFVYVRGLPLREELQPRKVP